MYRTFTGSLPFDSKDDAVLLGHHLITPAPPPESHAPDLDRRICAVIARALRKHPLNRYPSMDALREDIEKIATTPPPRTPKRARLVRDPDVYQPHASFGRSAALFFLQEARHRAARLGTRLKTRRPPRVVPSGPRHD